MVATLNQYIPVDLLRYQDEVLDITDKFKGRVGDLQDYIKLWVYSNSLPVDLTEYTVLFGGIDPQHKVHRHYLDMEDNQRLDNKKVGRVTLYFDEETFQCPGEWEEAYFKFINKEGKTVSTVNVRLRVLDDGFYARMGGVAHDYVAEFQSILKKLQEKGAAESEEFNDWINKYRQSLQDALAAVDDPKDGLMVRYATLLNMTKQIQETLKQAQFHDRPFQFGTVAEMKADAELMDSDEAITKGWDNYDDGHGAYWNIRVKHRNEVPDENNVISLNNGMVAERNSSLVSADSLEDLMYGYSIKIVHNQAGYPTPHVWYYENAIGTETDGLGTGPKGFGQDNTRYIPCEADYPDANTIIVRIPRNFYLHDAPNYKYGAWYIRDEIKSIKIDLGNVNDASAQAGDGKGSSYLSPGTGYFSKPTSPSDLRATYIDEHTQRLDWRN